MTRIMVALVAVLALVSPLTAQVAAPPALPAAAVEDELRLQLVILQSQLANALAASAKCEVDGPQSAKVAAAANTAAQDLVTSLAARGLAIDPRTNTIGPKPPPAAAPVAEPKAVTP